MKKFVLILLVLTMFVFLFTGCGKKESTKVSDTGVTVEDRDTDTTPDEVPTPPAPGKTVTMTGRSVMGGWFEHWGYDWEGPVEASGYALDYGELDSDLENIANSFKENVEGLPQGSVVFFKFCFADFDGTNLSTLDEIVKEVIETAREQDLRLIIGNALPMNREYGSPELVSEYKRYNSFLENEAARNQNVWVFDFYSVLSGSDGLLKPEYDVGDSHLNDRAYQELDKTFFPLLDSVFGN